MGKAIIITGIEEGALRTSEFCILPISFHTSDHQELTVTGEVHVVERLPEPLILGVNILQPNEMNIIWKDPSGNPAMTYHGSYIPIETRRGNTTPSGPDLRIRAVERCIIKAGTGGNIPVTFSRPPIPETAYLICPSRRHFDTSQGIMGGVPAAVVRADQKLLPFSNFGTRDILIREAEVLAIASVHEDQIKEPVFTLSMEAIFDGMTPTTDEYDNHDILPFDIQPMEDQADITEAKVSPEWGPEYEAQVRGLLLKHQHLFRPEMGMFNDGIKMPIPFRDDADLSKLKQSPYNLSLRDQEAIDEVINPLVKQDRVQKVPLGQPAAAASPAFVVWKNGKPRVVVDLRRVNAVLYPDAYPLPKQDTVLQALGGGVVFSSFDIVKSFFQQPIEEQDQWKTAFVTPHRGQEMLCVATMGLMNSPGFFQHRMELLLGEYLWKFLLVYIDDIIIFSRNLKDHLVHLSKALTLLEQAGITLSISKCYFAFPSIQALGHHVSRLGLHTSPQKVAAILELLFPGTLQDLEHTLGFFGYYRRFVCHYASIAEPMVNCKTKGFKKAPIKGMARSKHARSMLLVDFLDTGELEQARTAFESLKRKLTTAPVLGFPDFSRAFILYVDGSRERGYGVAVHQTDVEGIERPIVYLSKTLSDAEKNYWPTELETGALVWALQKLPQYTDHGTVTVHCDHQAVVQAFKDMGPLKGKRSDRLNSWRIFLAKYRGRMEIVHKPGKYHLNADGLSRMKTVTDVPQIKEAQLANVFTMSRHKPPAGETDEPVWKADLFQIPPEVRDSIVKSLPSDPHLGVVYRDICKRAEDTTNHEAGPVTTRETFRVDLTTKLMYQMSSEGHERLCLPVKTQRVFLQWAHDRLGHQGVTRVCDRLRRNAFIPRLRKVVRDYINACAVCASCKPTHQLPFGELHPVEAATSPFVTQTMDFITRLPLSRSGFDMLLTVTDQFSKWVTLVPGKGDWDTQQWAIAYYDYVYSKYGLPGTIISDRDPRFTSGFWKALFKRSGVKLALTAAYHPAANGQSERTNQSVEVAMRCLIADAANDRAVTDWDELLPDVEFALNTSTSATTGQSPFYLLYGVLPRSHLPTNDSEPSDADQFAEDRQRIREEAGDAVKLAQARMAKYYDAKHTPMFKAEYVWLKLAKGTDVGYRLPSMSALDVRKIGPFKVKRQISKVAFELELPSYLRMHPVISCIHLEPANGEHRDRQTPPPPLMIDGEERFIIDRILRKEQRKQPGNKTRRPYYRVRWQGYGPDEDSWIEALELHEQVPELVDAFEAERTKAARRRR